MNTRILVLVGVLFLVVSLFLSTMLMIPEVRDFRQCRGYSLRAFEGLLIYWGNYTLPASLSNISLSIRSDNEVVLNVTYGVNDREPRYAVVMSTFTYFIGNFTYFYVHVIPYGDTGLSVCLSALLITQRSYLLLPTLVSWICGMVIIFHTTLTHIERVFRKSLKGEKRTG
ncbi:MAG: hypothetical protein QN229_03395 [Desulfurococcaceae archaeon TW002]